MTRLPSTAPRAEVGCGGQPVGSHAERCDRVQCPAVTASRDKSWWRSYEVSLEEPLRWQIGPLDLKVERGPQEWLLGWSRSDPGAEPAGPPGLVSESGPPLEEYDELARLAFRETSGSIRLRPLLADRPVVSSPRLPLQVPPREEARLYIGSPLWVAVELEGSETRLIDVPLRRPSDTWFGPSTREGEVCFATTTKAILNLDRLPESWEHATTPVRISNESDELLLLERLRVPVPSLSLFATEAGRLWTEGVWLRSSDSTEMASIEIEPGAPPEVSEAADLGGPRCEPPAAGFIIRAFGSLFSGENR